MRRLEGVVQPYAWGSATRIPQLLGRSGDGSPQAELWLGAHPKAPSPVAAEPGAPAPSAPQTLEDLLLADPPGVLGQASVDRFGPRLPYLLKVLAADQPLSLQAHPDREQAQDGHARERRAMVASDAPDRVYADDWPKPELFCALADSEALCGFREPAATYALFTRLLGATPGTVLDVVEPLREGGPGELADVFGRLLRLGGEGRDLVDQVVSAAAESSDPDPEIALFAKTSIELNRFYPGDPGVLAALLMNRMALAPGEAIYLPPGNLHAHLHGYGVELMANSDNVLRGGLTGKFVAVDELLDILDFTPGQPPLVDVQEGPERVFCYRTPAPEFRFWRIEVDGVARPVPATGSGRILLTLEGRLVASRPGESLVLAQGESIFVAPDEDLQLGGSGTAVLAGPGL